MPLQRHTRKTVNRDVDRLAAPHVGELGLLEVGDHIDRVQWHHRHELGAGLHELPDPEGARTDGTVDRSGDDRVGEVELGLLDLGAGAVELGIGLVALGGQHRDLLARGDQRGFIAREVGLLLAQRRIGDLEALQRSETGLCKLLVADIVLPGQLHRGIRGHNGRLLLLDDRLLQAELGIEVADRRLGCLLVGTGLIERCTEIAVIDAGEDLAGPDPLVVIHQHLCNVAGNLRRHGGVVGLHVGIVGTFQIPPHRPVAISPVTGSCDKTDQCYTEETTLDDLPRRDEGLRVPGPEPGGEWAIVVMAFAP